MARVICGLPNASDLISGVKFSKLDDGRKISEEIDDATATRFASIPGYELDADDFVDEQQDEPAAPKLTKAQQNKLEREAKAAEAAKAKEESGAAETDAPETDAESPEQSDQNDNSEVF